MTLQKMRFCLSWEKVEKMMPDITAIAGVIGSLGFPIVACIYMAHINNKQTETHRAEVEKLTEVVYDLKLAINSLCEKIK